MEHNATHPGFSWIVKSALALGSLLWTHQAFATLTCLQDLYGGSLICTANDVQPTSFLNLNPSQACIKGTTFTLPLQANLVSTATSKYDIGLFVREDGGIDALTGTCYNTILTPIAPQGPGCTSPSPNYSSGTGPYDNLVCGSNSRTCGDIQKTDGNVLVDVPYSGTITALCQGNSISPDGYAYLGACTSWQANSSSASTCTSITGTVATKNSKCAEKSRDLG